MKLLMYPHGGSGNHGCEAIVRSTMLLTKSEGLLYSNNPDEDLKYGLGDVCSIRNINCSLSRKNFLYWKAFFRKNFLREKLAYDEAVFSPILEYVNESDYALSIGGDNYCYGMPDFILLINQMLRKKKIKNVLWGCSIEPSTLTGKIFSDLKQYNHIFARESITYTALREKGLNGVTLCPDPAFILPRQDLPLPEGFVEGNTVGINVSPLVIRFEKTSNIVLENYVQLIDYIIRHTDMQIALIPHVVWNHNDDRIPLNILYDKFKNTRRICRILDHSAIALKGFIARCRFMVAARTHASIAAYSEKVPTLVIGYSVKARGIAQDLFGTEQHYVVPIQKVNQKIELVEAFQWMLVHEEEIRKRLSGVVPSMKEHVLQSKEKLFNV